MPVTPELGRIKQESHDTEARLDITTFGTAWLHTLPPPNNNQTTKTLSGMMAYAFKPSNQEAESGESL